ncbi:LysR family transcriptional regulator [Microbacterium aerolatum]|uniref:LysR family transcriptional regulator n=1 Tax=Microbacterium aerolatum TaxID=153731 RepID=A0A511AE16_9MICO|nr:LysR family transcriptional regulator [Microbacterium aerolatum]GGB22612.1 LysR family transcriptional regulator [Microbacterium aerolatum]
MSSSALSDAITELERSLDVKLAVRRKAHGLTLTSAGERIVADARHLLRSARELRMAIKAEPGELVGPITIGCYPTLVPTVLPHLLRGFEERHPKIDLVILEITHERLDERLAAGEIDAAFIYDALVPGHPFREHLYALPQHILLAADHPLAHRESIRLEEMINDDLILLDIPPSSENTLNLFTSRGIAPRVRHRTASYEAVRTLVGRGLGYGILMHRPVNPASYEGLPVIMKNISPPVEPVAVDVIWSVELEPPQRVRALIDFAKRVAWPTLADASTLESE